MPLWTITSTTRKRTRVRRGRLELCQTMSILAHQRTMLQIIVLLLTVSLSELRLFGCNVVSAFQFSTPRPISLHHDRALLDAASVNQAQSFRQDESSPLPLGLALTLRATWSLSRQAKRFKLFASSSSSSSSSTSTLQETMNRLGLQGEKFDRWRHLQKLLDDETDPVDTNRLVYGVLERYYNNAKKTKVDSDNDNNDIDTAPERTTERLMTIGKILQEYSSPLDQSLGVITSSSFTSAEMNDSDKSSSVLSTSTLGTSNGSLHNALMEILPHPDNEPDEHKGTWDTVMELYGQEGVRIEEQKAPNNFTWKERCLAARILIYYDFLDYEES